MKYLGHFLKEHKGKVILNLLLVLAQSVGTLLVPFLIAGIVDEGILKENMGVIYRIGGCMMAVTLVSAAVSIWASWGAADFGALFGRDMREKLFFKSQELSIHQFDSVGLSSMVTRATADISTMQATIGMVLQMVIPAPLLIAVAFGMTFRASQGLALVLFLCMVVLLFFTWWMLHASKPISRLIQKKLDRINLLVRESVTGTRVIRAFGKEQYEEGRTGEAFGDYSKTMIRLGRMFAVVNPVVWLILGLCMAGILWVGAISAGNGGIQVGQITAVIEYSTLALSYLIMAAGIVVTLPKMRSCLDRLQEVLDTEPAICDLTKAQPQRKDASVISFEDVSFSYPGAEKAVLWNLNFKCNAGETTAIIGGTGSGKSTVADLLLRLHNVSGGTIRLYGVDIRDMTQEQLREAIGCVPQKAFLFSGTIASNLRMGNENASDARLWESLKIAQAQEFVSQLPLKLDTPVAQGGVNFSGGQRQRLAIARALVRDADLFIFDDSFSALDVKTDAALRRSLASYSTTAARLIIAQRVSTILNADRILVLDEGSVAGCGRHEELLRSCPAYRDIVKSQMEQKGA